VKKYYFILFILIALVLVPNITEAQCAMCKATVESSQGQKNSVAGGINQGIIYLMLIPYVLMAFIFRKQIVTVWKLIRGKRVADEDL
jgi:hypothetical protein